MKQSVMVSIHGDIKSLLLEFKSKCKMFYFLGTQLGTDLPAFFFIPTFL